MFYVLFVCKCVLPLGVNPIAVDKYININCTVPGRNDILDLHSTSILMVFCCPKWWLLKNIHTGSTDSSYIHLYIPVVVHQQKCDATHRTKTSVNPSADQTTTSCHCASRRRNATRYYNWQQHATTRSGVVLKGEINECPFTDPSDIRLYHLMFQLNGQFTDARTQC
jgi:hypothetical protein